MLTLTSGSNNLPLTFHEGVLTDLPLLPGPSAALICPFPGHDFAFDGEGFVQQGESSSTMVLLHFAFTNNLDEFLCTSEVLSVIS